MPPTLVLTRAELKRSVEVSALVTELRDAFVGYEAGGEARRVRASVTPEVTAMVLLPGTAPGIPAYTVKVHAKNPVRRPALTGVVCLHDLSSGDLLAVLDSGWLTSLRTGAGAALGTDVLARPDARAVGIIGAGAQGRSQLRALAAVRPLASVLAYDIDSTAAERFAGEMEAELGVPTRACRTVEEVAEASEVVMVATWSRTPVLRASHLHAGLHITSLGADEPGKLELERELLASALVVTDDERLAEGVHSRVDTSLSRVLRGEHRGREGDEVTVYSPLGLPMQDCVTAWHAYRRASALGLGTEISLEDG